MEREITAIFIRSKQTSNFAYRVTIIFLRQQTYIEVKFMDSG